MKKWLFIILFIIVFTGCNNIKIVHLYKIDLTQSITVYTNDNIRYIFVGESDNLPDTDYIKLDISEIDPLGDALHICWNEDIGWDIVVYNSKIIEIKLDTLRFNFSSSLPTDNRGLPTEKKFRNENCAIFDFYRMRLSPDKGAVVKIK